MNQLTSVGKFLFLVPFFFAGVGHLMGADGMKNTVPSYMPGGILWVYVTGLAMLGFVISVMIGKYDKLAAVLLAVMLVLFGLMVHFPKDGNPGDLLKCLGLAAGALMIADKYARDNSIIG
jgi:putative oxidoreductase